MLPLEPAVIHIEVAYALPHRAIVKSYDLKTPSTVADALGRAAADPEFSGIDIAAAVVGIYGVAARPDQALREGDRIEIYRPLAVDPKTARRARVREARRDDPRRGR